MTGTILYGRACRAPTCLAAAVCLAFAAGAATAQEPTGTVTVRTLAADAPMAGAQVSAAAVRALTDARGEARLRLPAGPHDVRVERIGYGTEVVPVVVRAAADTTITIVLEPEAIEQEAIIVRSTRADRRIEDEPVRVEVIGREEIEEKLLMTPGDIAMLLNETAGLRVQPTAPSLGGASVRIQGLRGRYTQILSDGLPLHGGQTGAFGPLQIPPMDLAQVEVIKGVASALYGASALGGVVNLISRRPDGEGAREVLLNQSTLGGTDAILWSADPLGERWGYTLLAGGHRQSRADVDGDGWADLPAFQRVAVRPRLFWDGGAGRSALFTLGAMVEDREGGTLAGRVSPDGTPFRESIETRRLDGGALVRVPVGRGFVNIRGSGALQWHDHGFGGTAERDVHTTWFGEAAWTGTTGAHTWVLGAALQREDYDARTVDGFDYVFNVPGLFAQDEYAPAGWLTVSASGRLDHHSEYGPFFNPRVSALFRPGPAWTLRASAGTGTFAPTPWTEETESIGLSRVVPPDDLEAERARSASLDVGRTIGPVELNATVFGSVIEGAVQARAAGAGQLELRNAADPTRTYGTELLVRVHREGLHATATHVYLRSTEDDPHGGGRREVPLTPRHTLGLVGALEREGRSRVGAEFYYTGRQQLEDNPYRRMSKPHVIVGFLVEHRFGRARLFLNAENILDTRQTRYDPLLLPARSAEGRWVTDIWAPLDGRSFNGGVRWEF